VFAATVVKASASETAACLVICCLIVFLCIKFFCDDDRAPTGPDGVSERDLEWWL